MPSAFRLYQPRRNPQQSIHTSRRFAGSLIKRVSVAASVCLLAAQSLFPADKPRAPSFSAVLQGKEADVVEAVEAVVDDTVIHGTYVYDRETTLNGAAAAQSSKAFENS